MRMLVPILTVHEQAAVAGQREAARAILAEARKRAPKDTGTLSKSGGVRIDDLTAQVSFTAKHAAYVHEDLDSAHPKGGGPKYLEQASDEIEVDQIIAKHLQQAVGGG